MTVERVPFLQLTLKIESRLDVVPVAGQLVALLCTLAGMQPLESCLIEVCVSEAMNNCVEHAYRLDPTQEVEVKANVYSDRLVLSIHDTGISADPTVMLRHRNAVFDVDQAQLETIPERGRGLAIIHEVMDSYEYSAATQENCFVMTKRSRLSPQAETVSPH